MAPRKKPKTYTEDTVGELFGEALKLAEAYPSHLESRLESASVSELLVWAKLVKTQLLRRRENAIAQNNRLIDGVDQVFGDREG